MGADSLAGDKLGGFNLTLEGKLARPGQNLDPKLMIKDTPSALDSSRALVYLP